MKQSGNGSSRKENEVSAAVTAKFILVSLFISAVTLLMGAAAHYISEWRDRNAAAGFAEGDGKTIAVVIDAGHGGEDGGCIGCDGTLEKNVNLDVSERMCEILSSMGIKCVMTRTEDKALYDMYGDLDDYKGQKKTYDLKNRLRFGEEHADAVFVSIHMNSFPQSSCRGVQIYYSPNTGESEALAEAVKESVFAYLQPENKRETKRAGTSIYILNRIKRPAILIECGFLSNPEECAALNDVEYKGRLALTLATAVAEYVSAVKTK